MAGEYSFYSNAITSVCKSARMGSGLSGCVSRANLNVIQDGYVADSEAAVSVRSNLQICDGSPSDQRITSATHLVPIINDESTILLVNDVPPNERLSTPQGTNSRSTSRRNFVDIDDMDANQREMFEHTAMSLGMDWDDFVYNVLYFGNGQHPNMDVAINNARDETMALHSENNTPYKLRPASSAVIQELKVDILTDLKDLHDCDCSVCKDHLELGASVIFLPTCAHCFHKDCLVRWLKLQGFCPVCRTTIGPKYSSAKAGVQDGIKIDMFRETSFEDLVRSQQPHISSRSNGGGKFRTTSLLHQCDVDVRTDRTFYNVEGGGHPPANSMRSYLSDNSGPTINRNDYENHKETTEALKNKYAKDDTTASPPAGSPEKLLDPVNFTYSSRKSSVSRVPGPGSGFQKGSPMTREGREGREGREPDSLKQAHSTPRNSNRSTRSLHGLKYVSSIHRIDSVTSASDDAQTRCSDATTLN